MDSQLINFPDADGAEWEDTHEGGLFVLLMVPKSEEHTDNCHVDVGIVNGIRMTAPDAVVSAPDTVWEPWYYTVRMEEWEAQKRVARWAHAENDRAVARWAARAWSDTNLSHPVLAAVHIGSIGQALRSDSRDTMWLATFDDLTDAGKAVWASLEAAFGIEPVLATFLDT